MLHPEQEASLTEIAAATHSSGPTVMREIDRLADAGLVRQPRGGNPRMIRADTDTGHVPPPQQHPGGAPS